MGLPKTNVGICLFRRGRCRCICWPFHYTPGRKNAICRNNSPHCRGISQCQDYVAFLQSIQKVYTILVISRLMVKALFTGYPLQHISFCDGTSYKRRQYQKACQKLCQIHPVDPFEHLNPPP